MATLSELVVKIHADISGLERNLSAAQRAVNAAADQMSAAGRKLTIGVTAPILAVGVVSIKAAADLDNLTRGLEAVSGSTAEASRQLARLREIGKLPSVEFEGAVRASIAFQAIGRDAAFAERTIRAVANAVTLSGGGQAQFEGVLTQMRQIASAGRLMGEELSVILENAPAMAAAFQNAFGTSSAETIRKMGLSVDQMFDRLLTGAERMPQVAGGATSAMENFAAASRDAAAALGQHLLPAVTPLLEGMSSLLERVRSLDPATARWAISIGAAAAALGPILVLVGNLIPAVVALKTAFASLAIVTGVGGALALGIGALAALFVKTQLDALAAAAAIDEYAQSLRGLSEVELLKRKGDLEDQISVLESQRARLRRTALLVDPTFTGSTAGSPVDTELQATEARLKAVRDALVEIRRIPTPQETRSIPIIQTGDTGRVRDAADAYRKLTDQIQAAARQAKELARATAEALASKTSDRLRNAMASIAGAKDDRSNLEELNDLIRQNARAWEESEGALARFSAAAQGLQGVQRGLAAVHAGAARALSDVIELANAIGQFGRAFSGSGSMGLPDLSGMIAGGVGILSTALSLGAQILGGNAEHRQMLGQNTEALNRLRDTMAGQATFGGQGAAAVLMGNRNSLELMLSLTTQQIAELARVGRSLGIEILASNGRLVSATLDQLREALRLSALSVTEFGRSLEGARRLMDARRDIFDITDPIAVLRDQYALLLKGLSEAAEVQFGLVGLDLSSGAGREALEAGLRKLFEAFEAGLLPSSMLEGFSTVDEFLAALLGADNALDKLAETTNRLNQSIINMAPGYRLAHRVWQLQDSRASLPAVVGGGGPSTEIGAPVVNIPIMATGASAVPDPQSAYRALWGELDRQARANPAFRETFKSFPVPR